MPSDQRPPIPAELRRAILVEAGHRCAIHTCLHSDVDVHHIEPWERCHEHRPENLIALCPNCHRRATAGEIDRKSLSLYKARLQRLYVSGAAPPEPCSLPEDPRPPWAIVTHKETHAAFPIYEALFEYPVFDPRVVPMACELNVLIEALVLADIHGVRDIELWSSLPQVPDEELRLDTYISGSFEILANAHDIVSIRFPVFFCPRSAAHPSHWFRVLNFQLHPGVALSLHHVFAQIDDALRLLQHHCAGKLHLSLDHPGIAPGPDTFRLFNLTPDGLLLTFQEYQVAPYVAGLTQVLVPWPTLQPHLNPNCAVALLASRSAA
jgi:hypothetical protein